MNAHIGMLLFSVVLTAVLLDVLGRRVRHGVYFGVTTGADFAVSEEGRRLARRFRLWTWTGAAAAGAVVVFAVRANQPVVAGLAPFLQVLTMAAAWTTNWREAKRHAIAPDMRRVAPLVEGPQVPLWVHGSAILSVALLAAVTIGLAMSYDTLPERFPRHYGITGEADAFGPKSPYIVFGPPVIGLLVTLMMFTILYGVAYRMRRGGSPDTLETRRRQRIFGVRIFGVMGVLVASMIAYVSAAPLFGSHGLPGGAWVMLSFVAGIMITAVVTLWRWVESPRGTGDDTPDDSWKLGMFYYNPNDPAWIVPRRDSIGFTINFARPIGWMTIVLILGLWGTSMLMAVR